jgi:hypothetical protein
VKNKEKSSNFSFGERRRTKEKGVGEAMLKKKLFLK